jgi:hypothetical protein
MKAAKLNKTAIPYCFQFWSKFLEPEETRMTQADENRLVNRHPLTEQLSLAKGALVSVFAGLLALLLSLAMISLVGLGNVERGFLPSLSARIAAACVLALTLSVVAASFIAPWLVAFLAIYFLVPSKSLLWRSWISTVLGVWIGVLALTVDALLYSEFSGGSFSELNISLLIVASLPAAVLGGTMGFVAAEGKKCLKTII